MNKRIYKFRAWDEVKRGWDDEIFIDLNGIVRGGFIDFEGEEVENPSIKIMQFTGLHDKNGKEIYEGDILRITGAFIGDSYIKPYNGYIYFVNGGFEISGDALFDTLSVNPCYWEVIGNRYENPELLREAEHG